MIKFSKLKKVFGIFLFLFLIGGVIVIHVALKKKCDDLIKQKVVLSEELQNQYTKQNNLYAKYQSLISEERIVGIAYHDLGMTLADPPFSILTISSEQVADLQKELKARL